MVFDIRTPGARKLEALNAASEVVQTARGAVEFARHGAAPYVLIFHGTPQGHHASYFGEPLRAAGFGTITPSRPGYLRTPLETGRTFAEQADAAAALLDVLEIDQVAAYGISGGGPSSIEFAARYPDRAKGLILEVAISGAYRPEVSRLTVALAMSSLAFWAQGKLLRRAPRLAVGQMVKMESTLDSPDVKRITADVLADTQKMDILHQLFDGPPFGWLRAGFENDMEQFKSADQLPRDQVQCPTLVVHGTHDGDVPYAHAQRAAREISGAELFTVERAWHLLALSDGDNAYQQAEIEFLQAHLS